MPTLPAIQLRVGDRMFDVMLGPKPKRTIGARFESNVEPSTAKPLSFGSDQNRLVAGTEAGIVDLSALFKGEVALSVAHQIIEF